MNGPRITNEERGVTFNKSALVGFLAILVTVIGGGVKFAIDVNTGISGTTSAIVALEERFKEDRAEVLQERIRLQERVRVLEASRAAQDNELSALRRDITDFRTELRDTTQLLRSIEGQLRNNP